MVSFITHVHAVFLSELNDKYSLSNPSFSTYESHLFTSPSSIFAIFQVFSSFYFCWFTENHVPPNTFNYISLLYYDTCKQIKPFTTFHLIYLLSYKSTLPLIIITTPPTFINYGLIKDLLIIHHFHYLLIIIINYI